MWRDGRGATRRGARGWSDSRSRPLNGWKCWRDLALSGALPMQGKPSRLGQAGRRVERKSTMLHCLSSLATLGVATDQRPQSLCPAGCNGHGFCDDSTCVCHPGCAGPAAHDPAARCLPLSPSHTAHRRRSRAQVLRRRLLCAGRRGRRGLAATLGARAAAARSARGLSGSRATRRLCTALPAQYMRHFQRRRMLAGRSDGLRVRWLLRHTALAALYTKLSPRLRFVAPCVAATAPRGGSLHC